MSNKTLSLYEFDEFRVDTNQRCLWHADQLVSLTPKAFETLLVLIRHRGEIVGKDVLLDEVWADTFVEESTLSQNILTLRKTLAAYKKDTPFIVTVPRRGYRFVAEVREISADDEIFVVERRTRTRIVAEQKEIHDSKDAAETAIAKNDAPPKNLSRQYLIFGVVPLALIILTAAFFAVRYFLKTPDFARMKFQKFSVANLVSDSEISRAVISPNGKYLALVKKTGAAESLIVRQIAEANSLEIVQKFDGRFNGVAFAPESDYVFYTVYPKNARAGELYKIPLFGGVPQLIIKDIDSAVSISNDKKKIAFVRRLPNEQETVLIVADADGKNERRLAARSFGEGFQNAAFSPDGRLIAASAYSKNFEKPMEIILVGTENGEQTSLTPRNWTWIGQTAWLKDGSGVAFVAFSKETPNLTDEVWLVSYPDGAARLLENGIDGVFGVSLTDDGNSLVTVKRSKITSFAVSPADDLTKETQLLTKNGDESLMPLGADWTPDGRIVFSAINNGNADVWAMNSDAGGQPKQLTSEANADILPKVTADGKDIYFLSNRTGLMSVWRMNADGTNQQKITESQDVFAFDLSPGGTEIFYTARAGNIFMQQLWKISADGSGAKRLTEKPLYLPKIAPDGKTIAGYFSAAENQSFKLTLLAAENGALLRQIETPATDGFALFDWSPDGQSLYLATRLNGATTLWRQPVDGQAPTKLKDWQNEAVFRLDVSRDGKALFYEKGVATNSVLLLRSVSE